MRTLCVFCGSAIDPTQLGVYRQVEGWEQIRKAGGTNKITLPVRSDRFACRACIDERKAGISTDQTSLW